MKRLEKTVIAKIIEADKELRGTKDWAKYRMYGEFRLNGSWYSYGFAIPTCYNTDYIISVYIKTIKSVSWLYVETRNDIERYELKDSVRELIGC